MLTWSNGNSFDWSNGHSMSVAETLAAGQYPEPWWIRLMAPVQPGAAS